MNEALRSIAIGIAKGLLFAVISMTIFAIIAMLMFRTSPRFRRNEPCETALGYAFPLQLYRLASTKVDLCLFLLRTFVWGPIVGLIAALFAGVSFSQMLVAHFGPPSIFVHNTWLILAIQFLVGILAAELSGYVYHRLAHANRFVWTAHRLHHSAETMTFLTGGRGHPLDDLGMALSVAVIAGPITAVSLYFTGTTPHAYLPTLMLAFGIFAAVEDKFNHSHVPLSFGPLNRIFMSGHMHQIHHSAELRHRDKNFGGPLSLFDWIFGTIYIPKPDEIPILGLSEKELGKNNPHQNVRDSLLEPFAYLRRELSKGSGQTLK